MEDANPEFPTSDVVLVVGANNVVNPAAHNDKNSLIFGMPILIYYFMPANVSSLRDLIVFGFPIYKCFIPTGCNGGFLYYDKHLMCRRHKTLIEISISQIANTVGMTHLKILAFNNFSLDY